MKNYKLERLLNGETFITKEGGNSMKPLIKSKQKHIIEPVTDLETLEIGDIVYCKIGGRFLTHLIKAKHETKGFLIASNQGVINGWTKQIYGKVIKVL
jgi:hypothetical protein